MKQLRVDIKDEYFAMFMRLVSAMPKDTVYIKNDIEDELGRRIAEIQEGQYLDDDTLWTNIDNFTSQYNADKV